MKVNWNTMWKKGIKIFIRVGFGFHDNDFLFLFPFLVSNPNTVMNGKRNGFSIPIPYSCIPSVP